MRVRVEPGFQQWRTLARSALADRISPEQIDFEDATMHAPVELFDVAGDRQLAAVDFRVRL